MDMDYAELAKQAAILIAVFAPASAALVDMLKRFVKPLAENGEWAASIAGLMTVAGTTCGILGILPEWIIVLAVVFVAGYAPKVVRDYARAPKKADDHAAVHEEFNEGQGE